MDTLPAKYPQHLLYTNPSNPAVCPLLALALYMGMFFGVNSKPSHGQTNYFPGIQFVDGLTTVLQQNEDVVRTLGYHESYREIGAHSICKGATKWLSSGWSAKRSLSNVHLHPWWLFSRRGQRCMCTCMTYEAKGDAFCGRMLSLLPLLKSEFALSPLAIANLPSNVINEFFKGLCHRCG